MKYLIIIFIVFFVVSIAGAQVPELVDGWPYITTDGMWAVNTTPRFSMTENIDLSAVFFNTVTNEIDKFHFDGSFFSGWPVIADELIFCNTPVVVDIDHDCASEIVTIGTQRTDDNHYDHSEIFIVDDDGMVFPGFPLIFHKPAPPNVADFDNDGEYELIFFCADIDSIYCIDRYGNSEPGWPVGLPENAYGSIGGGGTVGDFDHDGYLEYLVKSHKYIYVFRYDGSMQEGFPIEVIDDEYWFNPWFGPYLADVDLDGHLEILVTGDNNDFADIIGYAAVYEHDGQIKQGWPRIFPGFPWQMPIAADINGDNIPEIGFAAGSFTYFVDVNGNDLPGWPVEFLTPEGRNRVPMSDIIVVDIDGDGDCEIFSDYNTTLGYLFAADHLGQELPGYPIEVEGAYLWRPPTFGYDETSHRLYMGLYTGDFVSYVNIYLFPDSTGPPDQWPMMSHDNLQTKNYNFVDNVTAIHEGKEPLPKTYVLMQNYPNPFNSSTIIQFSLPKEEEIELAVYDILGRKVAELASGRFPAGSHKAKWDSADCASGMYFYTMQTEKAQISRKMMLLR